MGYLVNPRLTWARKKGSGLEKGKRKLLVFVRWKDLWGVPGYGDLELASWESLARGKCGKLLDFRASKTLCSAPICAGGLLHVKREGNLDRDHRETDKKEPQKILPCWAV